MTGYISLFDRLSAQRPLGYSGHFFKYKGQLIRGINSLIDIVLERYSSMFGFVDRDTAEKLQERLAHRYSISPASVTHTFSKAWGLFNVYPRHKARAMIRQHQALAALQNQYEKPHGTYCEIKKTKICCYFCGNNMYITHVKPDGKKTEIDNGVVLNGWYAICRQRRCRAIAAHTKPIGGKYRQFPLIKVLLEVSKNGGNNAYKRRLEKHFIRHAG